MIGVIDSSALLRLFIPDGPIPEGLEEFMRGVERGLGSAISPELILVESANVLHRKRKLGELTETESTRLLSEILSMPIRTFHHRPLIPSAFELAAKYDLTVYDALYLALAADHGAIVFSADENMLRIANILRLR